MSYYQFDVRGLIWNYPMGVYGIDFKKITEELHVIQSKYNLDANMNLSAIMGLIRSPVFKL